MSAESPTAAAPAASGAAVQAPPAPVPSPQYNPPPPVTPPTMAENGAATGSSGPFSNFFSDINVLDVTISAFIIGAVIYSIQYHKMMMMLEKTGYADISTRVQKLESALESAKKKSQMNASGPMKKKRGLITL